MFRGYRSIIVAVAGLALIGAAPSPNNKTSDQANRATAKIESALDSISAAQNKLAESSETGEYQAPCDATQPNYKSDLCAQWYAASAARDAADWAFWALVVGLIGAVGIVAALWLTIDSNRIARDTAKRQLRAYIHPEGVVSLQHKDQITQSFWWSFRVVWKNSGATPAIQAKTIIWPEIVDESLDSNYRFDQIAEDHVPMSIGPNCTTSSVRVTISGDLLQKIVAREKVLYLWGWIKYRDIFDDSPERATRFCFKMEFMGHPIIPVSERNKVEWNGNLHPFHNSST